MTTTKWATLPSCPVCESRAEVEPMPAPIMGRHLFCAGCCLVFAGTEMEWRANADRRKARAKLRARDEERQAS
jgi:hypothetical protein